MRARARGAPRRLIHGNGSMSDVVQGRIVARGKNGIIIRGAMCNDAHISSSQKGLSHAPRAMIYICWGNWAMRLRRPELIGGPVRRCITRF